MKLNFLHRAGLGLKLDLAALLIVFTVLGIFAFAMSRESELQAEEAAIERVQQEIKLLASMMDTTDRDYRQRTAQHMQTFLAQLAGRLELRAQDSVDIKGKATPLLTLDGKALNLNFGLVDPYTHLSGAVATVFARSGEDFVRVTTSLKNDKGERAVGTLLDREHPGYKAIAGGTHFEGLATLFGRTYMTRYEPLRDSTGTIIGVAFVGTDITDSMATLKKTIGELRIGKTGYYFAVDAKPGKSQGLALVHPAAQGKSLLNVKDAEGQPIIQKMIEQQSGTLDYRWQNPELGETVPRAKIAVFVPVPAWGWIIGGGTYVDEFSADLREDRNKYIAIAAGLLLLSAVLFYALIRKLVTVPLARIRDAAQRLAAGDLSVRLQSTTGDEIGAVSRAMDLVGTSLTELVRRVRANAESVATASAQIAHANQDLSARTEHQAGALQQTAAAGQQLGDTVQSNLATTEQIGSLTHSARDTAQHGAQAVSQVVDTMASIEQTSKKVAEISGLIDGLAFQTNILALNAAVEAARAGEQGRGFAVVAGEVRSLAQRSAEAAKEIKALIDRSVQSVLDGSRQATQAGGTMQDVMRSIERVALSMGEITTASRAQTRGVQELSGAMNQVDQATQQNAALAEEMAAAAGSLEQQAQQLVSSVAVFKLA